MSSAASPIFSRAEAELWMGESPEKRDGELERICSFADSGQDGLTQFSPTASGLLTDDRDDRLCRCTLLTNGRVEKPPGSGREKVVTPQRGDPGTSPDGSSMAFRASVSGVKAQPCGIKSSEPSSLTRNAGAP